MKNTVYAFAKEDDEVAQPESFGIRLARHFVDNAEPITRARVKLEMYPWTRLEQPARLRPRRALRPDGDRHLRRVGTWIVSGVKDLVVLKSTDSEFWGYLQDQYTTLQPTNDRVMATSLVAQWWHTGEDVDWGKSYDGVLAALRRLRRSPQPGPAAHAVRDGRPCWATSRRSPKSASRRRTSTTSSTTWPASAWRTTTRCSTPTTARTA